MSVIGNTYQNIRDFAEADAADVIEVLRQQNPILDDAIVVEANMGTIHRTTIRTGLPTPTWGRLYKGIPQNKSGYQQVDDTTGFLEARSAVDTRLLDLSPDSRGQVRLNEAAGQLEGMNQEMATGVFYHDTATTPEKFKGLSARYNTLGGGGAGNQIIDAGGAGSDNTSIWIVTWSDRATHLLYPKGTQAGIKRDDKGQQRVQDAAGDAYYVEEEIFTWHMGLTVRDWRYNARVANIDVSNLQAGNVDIYKFLRKAYYKLQSRPRRTDGNGDGMGAVRQAIYCNRDVMEALDAMATNGGAAGSDNFVRLTPMELEGREILTYRGIPLRECDAILNTEARVV